MKKKTTAELHKEISALKGEIENLREERAKLRKEKFQLDSLRVLWKRSALRYQGIAAALSHAYNNTYPPDAETYGRAVSDSHSLSLAG